MKIKLSILFFNFTFLVFSQENITEKDSTQDNVNNLFIESYNNQLNIKFDLSNDIENYNISFMDEKAIITPNLNFRLALDFNYKFVSLSLGARIPSSESNINYKGDSYIFRFKVKLLFNKWFHQFEYNYTRGYYIKNSNNFYDDELSNLIQFPRLKTYVFSGSTAYKFNDNFSLKAVSSQTEIQLKSAGSFIPSLDYWVYQINGTEKVINPSGELILRDSYNDYSGMATMFNIGYYYTFVYKKNWYAHLFLDPGIGIDFYQVNTINMDENYRRNFNSLIMSIQSGVALGYSSKKYYFGVAYNNTTTNQNQYKDNFQFNTSRNVFHTFIGYRFKAPKQVKETIDYIGKKVPILEIENQN